MVLAWICGYATFTKDLSHVQTCHVHLVGLNKQQVSRTSPGAEVAPVELMIKLTLVPRKQIYAVYI